MATKLSKTDYEMLKSLSPEDLTAEDRKDIIDYERAEAQAPSLDDVEWAVKLVNAADANPSTVGKAAKESGEYDIAKKYIEDDRRYVALKGPRQNEAYVQPVKKIPDDLIDEKQFNFNWKSAYENQPGNEKLRDTEADYDKLKKFIDSKMFDLNDQKKLQELAYDLHMYNYNTMKWEDFINSEQGEEFKKYLKDVEKYQKDKEIEKIWSGEEPSPQWTPFGYKNVPGAYYAASFGLPVAKRYARNNYENINGLGDMAGPLLTDLGTNAIMMSNRPAAAIAAPVITNAGQWKYNDEDPVVAGLGATIGAAVNYGTPRAAMAFTRSLNTPGKLTTSQEVSKVVDDALATTRNVKDKLNSGSLYTTPNGYVSDVDKVIYTDLAKNLLDKKYTRYKIKPLSEAKNKDIIPVNEYKEYLANKQYLRSFSPKEQKVNKTILKEMEPDKERMPRLVDNVFAKKEAGDPLTNYSFDELRAMGYNPKESVGSFVSRETPDNLRAYVMNMLGRDRFANPYLRFPAYLGFDVNKAIDERQEKKKRKSIKEVFGE